MIDKIFKAPLVILVISAFVVGVYVYLKPIEGFNITIGTPIALGIIIILYLLGAWLGRKKKEIVQKETEE